MKNTKKMTGILAIIFVMVLSFTVGYHKLPETKYFQESIESLEDNQNTIMKFSGATIATSLAISALPDDFASPLADTVSDLNIFFVFMFAVVFLEKLIVIEGTKISLAYIIPAAGVLYILFMLTSKDVLRKIAIKIAILGCSLVLVIPFSTHFTETVCADYMNYVEETIAETEAGADKVNEVLNSDDDTSFLDKISNVFNSAIQGVSDLLTYFKNVIRRCINSVAIMIVINFVLPLIILMLFRTLLNEMFKLNIPKPNIKIRLPKKKDFDDEED